MEHAQSAAAAPAFGGFRKRTYSFAGLARSAFALVPQLPRAGAIWLGGRVDPKFREELMISVARVNGCRYCVFTHETWAMHDGVSREALDELAAGSGPDFTPAQWLAFEYGKALTLGADTAALRARLSEFYSDAEIADLSTVVNMMTLANLCGNTVDAFFSRLGGNPAAHSRLIDELLIVAITTAVGVWAVIPLCLWRRQGPIALLKDFLDFSRTLEAQLEAAA